MPGAIEIPKDILERIDATFRNVNERSEVKKIIEDLWVRPLNVGAAQLARSILILSGDNINRIKEIVKDFGGDPRDIIMEAEAKVGNPGHYFISAFDKTSNK